jgi:hypothetical protein
MTIPQTNFRIGYFINDHYNYCLGVDHVSMCIPKSSSKYNGNINTGTPFDGVYNRTPTNNREILMYEHTDG